MSILPQVREKTLLDKALESSKGKRRRPCACDIPQRIDLALAYVSGHITGPQAAEALGVGSSNAAHLIAGIILTGIRQGILKVERVKR